MKVSPILTAMAALLLLMTSCKNNNKSGLYIPKDAAFVFHLNTSSLSSKLSWEEVKASAWFKEAYTKSGDAYAQKLMDNPDASGIDAKSDFAFFVQRKGKGSISLFEGSVKDAAAFEALCKKIGKTEKTEKSGEWNLLVPDNSTVVAWNSSKFAVINDLPLGAINPMGNGFGEPVHVSTDSLKIFVKDIMTLSGDNSLFEDERFASLLEEKGDMHLWMNSGALYADMTGLLAMMKMGNLFSGNVSAATLAFEDGKISMKSKTYMGKEMQELMEKWESKKVDAAVFNRIPSEKVLGVMAANIDPASLQNFFKAIGFDGLINMMLAKQNITINEVLAATKGEFVFAFSDLSMQKRTTTTVAGNAIDSNTFTKPEFNILFATNVAQRPTFEKMLSIFSEGSSTLPFSYKLNDQWFVAANNPQTADGFMAGNGSKKAFADKISGHPFGMYLDLQGILKTNFSEESAAKSMLAESAAIWEDMIATGGETKNGATTAEFVVNLVDKKTNSLKQLNRFIDKMFEASKQRNLAFDNNIKIDTATAAPLLETAPQ